MVDLFSTHPVPHNKEMLLDQRLSAGAKVSTIWNPPRRHIPCHSIHDRRHHLEYCPWFECHGWHQSVLEAGVGLQVFDR